MGNPGPETLLPCACSRLLSNTPLAVSDCQDLISEERYSLIKMYTTLWICATLVEGLSNLALRVHYNDGYGRVAEAVP
jgi:hypothetical protein